MTAHPGDRVLAWLPAALCLLWLVGWAPHYLTWPWWIDLDAYAALAQGWSQGRMPYRDVAFFNAPGQVYAHWVIGMLCGWGHGAAVYGFDVLILLGLGSVLIAWSRRVWGAAIPGLLACVMLLAYYLDQDYRNVAQRDWQGPLMAVAAILVMQTWRGRAAWVCAGGLLAGGLAIRPHVVFFIPAAVLAVLAWGEEDARGARGKRLAWFGASCAVVLSLAAIPVIASAAGGHLFRTLAQVGYGTRYAQFGQFDPLGVFAWQFGITPPEARLREPVGWLRQADRIKLAIILMFAFMNMMMLSKGSRQRAVGLSWLAAGACVLFYAPVHPMRHLYLAHPLRMAVALNFAVVAGAILGRWGQGRAARAAWVVGLSLVAALPGWPRFWSLERSVEALRDLAREQDPVRVPLGAGEHFAPGDARSPFTWDNYRNMLIFVRKNSAPETLVANLLRNVPFPAANGPVGRASPLPAEGGVAFLYLVNPRAEVEFAAALQGAPPGTLVVWDPFRPSFTPDLEMPTIQSTVRRHFEPIGQFGPIEVRRKR